MFQLCSIYHPGMVLKQLNEKWCAALFWTLNHHDCEECKMALICQSDNSLLWWSLGLEKVLKPSSINSKISTTIYRLEPRLKWRSIWYLNHYNGTQCGMSLFCQEDRKPPYSWRSSRWNSFNKANILMDASPKADGRQIDISRFYTYRARIRSIWWYTCCWCLLWSYINFSQHVL